MPAPKDPIKKQEWIDKLRKISKPNKGRFKKGDKHTEEWKEKMSGKVGILSHSWKGGKPKCKECEKILSNYNNNYCQKHKMTDRVRGNMSIVRKKNPTRYWLGKKRPDLWGENHPRWITDRTLLKTYGDSEERRSPKYKDWRHQCIKRDKHICRINNKDCFGNVIVHHILSWREYPELKYEINNGITLCHAHHPRKRAEEKRLIADFQRLVSVSNGLI